MIVRRLLLAGAAGIASLALVACGTPLEAPLPPNDFVDKVATSFGALPVWWLGPTFEGVPLVTAPRDPGSAVDVQYGNCVTGLDACQAFLTVVTVPDGSFVPGAPGASPSAIIRGAPAYVSAGGRIVHIPTGGEVVSIFALRAGDAVRAARLIVNANPDARASTSPARAFPPFAPSDREPRIVDGARVGPPDPAPSLRGQYAGDFAAP